MICQYAHLPIGKALTLVVHNMVCTHCGQKVPGDLRAKAVYRGHKAFTPTEYRIPSPEQEIMADWFSLAHDAPLTCKCGKPCTEIFWQCKGDWYASFFEAVEKVLAPVSASAP